eukprot:TRINITY_DN548_c1_g2_i1.p1 TRINITY_DN548_c1_g2~~TRINITY_DN548_c1_g2_i1.p1  ORF type:complete len:1108 (+),score=152.38 TRINITY_DN548_c1_g2_i1:117-3440(+)
MQAGRPEINSAIPLPADRGAQCPQVCRIGCGVGYVIHGFIFEFDDGSRVGRFLEDNQEVMDIHDDQNLQKRKLRWQDVEPGDFIVRVSGKHCRMGYLAGSITFHTHAGRIIEFFGKRHIKFTKDYCFDASPEHFVCNVLFSDGHCTGIEDRPVRKNFHFKIMPGDPPLGLLIVPTGEDKTWQIANCRKGSWALQQGLRVEDHLISINSLSPKGYSKEEVDALLKARPVELHFERQGGIRKVTAPLPCSLPVPSQLLSASQATPAAAPALGTASTDPQLLLTGQALLTAAPAEGTANIDLQSLPTSRALLTAAPAERTASINPQSPPTSRAPLTAAAPAEGTAVIDPQSLPTSRAPLTAAPAEGAASADAAESTQLSNTRCSEASSTAKVSFSDVLQLTESQETRGSYQQAVEALNSKMQWRYYMKPYADRLEDLFLADYKVRKQWDFACSICQKYMGRGAGDHIPSDAHRKALLYEVQSSIAGSTDEENIYRLAATPRLQNFVLLGTAVTFDHLSGEIRAGSDGQIAVVPVQPPEDGLCQEPERSVRSKKTFDAEAAPDLVSLVAARTYLEAIERRDLWIGFLKPYATQLRNVQESHWEENWQLPQWKCAMCNGADMSEADKHLLSKEHHDSMYYNGPQRACFWEPFWDVQACKGLTDARYVQLLSTPHGVYLFNHVTGEQGYEHEVAHNSASSVPPPLQFSLLHRGELAPCGYLADRCEAVQTSEDATEFRACLEFGWTPKQIQTATGTKKQWSWHVKVPNGQYSVVLGLRGLSDVHYPNTFKQCMGWVNKMPGVCEVQEDPQELTFHGIQVSDNWITVQGAWSIYCPVYCIRIARAAGQTVYVSSSRPQKVTVPPFSEKACGVARHWNSQDTAEKSSELAALNWSLNGKNLPFRKTPSGTYADPGQMLRKMLESRPGPQNVSLLQRLGPPLRHEDGWFSFAWVEFTLEAKTKLEAHGGTWKQAWHGSKLEALYSILYHKHLFASRDRDLGERLFEGMPGVYVHKNRTSQKAENYLRFVPLCEDGIFWACKWEVLVDRKRALDEHKNTDQWVQAEDSVQLVALWLCGRTFDEMRSGDQVSKRWFPEHEADPRKNRRGPCTSYLTAV